MELHNLKPAKGSIKGKTNALVADKVRAEAEHLRTVTKVSNLIAATI